MNVLINFNCKYEFSRVWAEKDSVVETRSHLDEKIFVDKRSALERILFEKGIALGQRKLLDELDCF